MKAISFMGIVGTVLILFSAFILPIQTYAFSSPTNPTNPYTTSFDVVRGIILVKAEINGEIGNFILDTGSPMMILNDKNERSTIMQANTLTGNLSGEWKKIGAFSWAGVHKFNLNALSMDISHLEYITEKNISGLIGYDFFGDFDLMLDFQNQIVTLVPSNYVSDTKKWRLKSELPFVLEGHIPVIEANIGDVHVRLGLDTGAGTNLLAIGKAIQIAPELLAPITNASIVGLGAGASQISAADVLETTIGGENYWNMRYVFTDISRLKNLEENKVDGLLGYPFFRSGKFTINYGKKMIGFWE